MSEIDKIITPLKKYIDKNGKILTDLPFPETRPLIDNTMYIGKTFKNGRAVDNFFMPATDRQGKRIYIVLNQASLLQNVKLTLNRMLNLHNTINQINDAAMMYPESQHVSHFFFAPVKWLAQGVGKILMGLFKEDIKETVSSAVESRIQGSVGVVGGVVANAVVEEGIRYANDKVSDYVASRAIRYFMPEKFQQKKQDTAEINKNVTGILYRGLEANDELSRKAGKQSQCLSHWSHSHSFFSPFKRKSQAQCAIIQALEISEVATMKRKFEQKRNGCCS